MQNLSNEQIKNLIAILQGFTIQAGRVSEVSPVVAEINALIQLFELEQNRRIMADINK